MGLHFPIDVEVVKVIDIQWPLISVAFETHGHATAWLASYCGGDKIAMRDFNIETV